MMAVTITFVSPFSLAADSAEYVMSPGFVGVGACVGGARRGQELFVCAGGGDDGSGGGCGRGGFDGDAFGERERATAVFAIMDKVGKSLRFTMSVRALEAGAYGGGELLYLIGGSSGGEEVWRTADGRNWTQLPVYPPVVFEEERASGVVVSRQPLGGRWGRGGRGGLAVKGGDALGSGGGGFAVV